MIIKTYNYEPPDDIDGDVFEDYTSFTNKYQFSRTDLTPFKAEARFWQLGDVVLTEQRIGGTIARRGSAQIMSAPADYITLISLFDGEIVYCDSNGDRLACAGDLLVLDASRIFTLRSPSQHSASMTVARSTVTHLIDQRDQMGPLDRSPETALVHDIFRASVRHLESLDQGSAIEVANILFRMLQLALASGSGARSTASDGSRKRALTYLAARAPGRIDVVEMSRELGISRSGLYRMFAADGGVLAFDRRRRLHLIHRDILQAPVSEPLGNVGLRHGFGDAATLSRQFKKQFGYSMTALRKLYPAIEHTLQHGSTIQHYRRLIQRVS